MNNLHQPHNGFIKMALEDMHIATDFFSHREYTSPAVEEKFMTIAETLDLRGFLRGEQRGEQRGIQEGQYKLLLAQLEDRFGQVPLAIIRHLKNASSDELLELSRRVLHINTIEELI